MIHLILGNTGSGKTTYAEALKQRTNGVIFSIDKWNKTLFLADKKPNDGLLWFLERIERSEHLIMQLVQQLENSKTDTILDLGFARYEHRKKFMTFAISNDYEIRIHFLNIPTETRWKRIVKRNEDKGVTFEFKVSREDFDFMETWFEIPTEEEIDGGIVITD